MKVAQLVPSLFPNDGVGNHTLATHEALRHAGVAVETWAESFDPRLTFVHRHGRNAGLGSPDVLLYQCSTGSEGMADALLARPEPLAIYHHNITPPEFFDAYDGLAAKSMRRGMEELRRVVPRTQLAFAASAHNADELRCLGVKDVHVVPPYSPPVLGEPDAEYLDALNKGKQGVDILFVGRLMPHKGQLALVRLAAVLKAGLTQPIRLFLVGGDGPRTYVRAVEHLAERLGVERAVKIATRVSPARLAAHYRAADVFVCMSEHEGFCIPLVEAMRAGLPVVALDRAAVAETLGGAGVLVRQPEPLMVAEIVARLTADEALRAEVIERQRARAKTLDRIDRTTPLITGLTGLATSRSLS